MILVDTREQKPIWNPKKSKSASSCMLPEGDYTTHDLLGIAHIERKSPIDLYGSIIQNHERFRNEIQRAKEKNIKLAVFVECPKEKFIAKKFHGGFRLHVHPGVLRKIIDTMEKKYSIEFVWCANRNDFKSKATLWFENQRELNKKVNTSVKTSANKKS